MSFEGTSAPPFRLPGQAKEPQGHRLRTSGSQPAKDKQSQLSSMLGSGNSKLSSSDKCCCGMAALEMSICQWNRNLKKRVPRLFVCLFFSKRDSSKMLLVLGCRSGCFDSRKLYVRQWRSRLGEETFISRKKRSIVDPGHRCSGDQRLMRAQYTGAKPQHPLKSSSGSSYDGSRLRLAPCDQAPLCQGSRECWWPALPRTYAL